MTQIEMYLIADKQLRDSIYQVMPSDERMRVPDAIKAYGKSFHNWRASPAEMADYAITQCISLRKFGST